MTRRITLLMMLAVVATVARADRIPDRAPRRAPPPPPPAAHTKATVKVTVDRAWTLTRVRVRRGQEVSITARGRITSGGRAAGPDGATGARAPHVDATYPLAAAKPLALIGRIGEGSPFLVGAGVVVTSPRDGELMLGINDDRFGDNRGSWSATIEVRDGHGGGFGGAMYGGLGGSLYGGIPAPVADLKPPVASDLAGYIRPIKGAGKLIATIDTSLGAIHCELFADKAPMTVANFVGLATAKKAFRDPRTNQVMRKAFYDGLVFHRVIPDFMIQGGDPQGSGMGGPGYQFANEVRAGVRMRPGSLAMANAGPDTNGSQFFITESTPSYLDGKYSIFGQCAELDVVRRIARVTTDRDRPRVPITMRVSIGRGRLPPIDSKPQVPPVASGETVANTQWTYCNAPAHGVTFEAGGNLAMESDSGAKCRTGKWKQTNATVTFDCNAYSRWSGVLNGNEIRGSWNSANGAGQFCLTRKASAVPESPRDPAPSAKCAAGQHEWSGGCYNCPAGTRWVGGGMCQR